MNIPFEKARSAWSTLQIRIYEFESPEIARREIEAAEQIVNQYFFENDEKGKYDEAAASWRKISQGVRPRLTWFNDLDQFFSEFRGDRVRIVRDFDEYQSEAIKTMTTIDGRPFNQDEFLTFSTAKAAAEAGELSDAWLKIKWQGHKFDRDKLAEEIGDVLWTLAGAAESLDVDLEFVARVQLEKQASRFPGQKFSAEASIARKDKAES